MNPGVHGTLCCEETVTESAVIGVTYPWLSKPVTSVITVIYSVISRVYCEIVQLV